MDRSCRNISADFSAAQPEGENFRLDARARFRAHGDMSIKEHVREEFRKLYRGGKGESLQDLAEDAGVTRQTIADFIEGVDPNRKLALDMVENFCAARRLSPVIFMGLADEDGNPVVEAKGPLPLNTNTVAMVLRAYASASHDVNGAIPGLKIFEEVTPAQGWWQTLADALILGVESAIANQSEDALKAALNGLEFQRSVSRSQSTAGLDHQAEQ